MSLSYLDRPIAFHRVFVDLMGSVSGAVFLSQLVYWHLRVGRPFYKSMKDWTEETGLSRREQETARKKLIELGLLKIERKGVPAKLHFALDQDALERVVVSLSHVTNSEGEPSQGSLLDVANKNVTCDKQVCTDVTNKIGGSVQTNTETTQETTSNIRGSGKERERQSDKGTPPDDWKPKPGIHEFCIANGLPDPESELKAFIKHAQERRRNFESINDAFEAWLKRGRDYFKKPAAKAKRKKPPAKDFMTIGKTNSDGTPNFQTMGEPQLLEYETALEKRGVKANSSGLGFCEHREKIAKLWFSQPPEKQAALRR